VEVSVVRLGSCLDRCRSMPVGDAASLAAPARWSADLSGDGRRLKCDAVHMRKWDYRGSAPRLAQCSSLTGEKVPG
jgi:hypothetical protein